MSMSMHLGIGMSQVQKQILAPRMIQSMQILQTPIMALQQHIQKELQENPVLEVEEPAAVPEGAESDTAIEEPAQESPSDPDFDDLGSRWQ